MIIFTKDLPKADFSALCFEGLSAKGLSDKAEYKKRLEYEISVIEDKGYSELFLGLKYFLGFCKKYEIESFINGSLVAWVLGITHFDPLKNGLIFELFVNPLRLGIGYVYVKYDEIAKNEFSTSATDDEKKRIYELYPMSFDEMVGDKDNILIYKNDEVFLECSGECERVWSDIDDDARLENAFEIVGIRHFEMSKRNDFYLDGKRLLFTEQIIEILISLSGCKAEFADILRRAMSKDESELLENEFLSTCADKQKARDTLKILKEFSKCSLHKAFLVYEAIHEWRK